MTLPTPGDIIGGVGLALFCYAFYLLGSLTVEPCYWNEAGVRICAGH